MNPQELNEQLADLVARYDVPGASVSVLEGDEVVDAAAGVVNLRTGVEARPDSPFMIQSITKVWTATLVMQLVDDGLVDLDDPVRRHLPAFRTAEEEQSAAVTVRHLLTHTGGFEGDIWAETTCGDDALQRFVEDLVPQATQHTEPGELYSYCSAGMAVLGRLVEVLRGTTFATALRERLTEPLGIDGVVNDAGEALGHRTAIGHVRPGPGEPWRPVRTWAVMPPSNPAAGNQLAMPARGLTALARLHLSGGSPLLSDESARLMRAAHAPVPASLGRAAQGLGWRVRPTAGVVEHGGDTIGSAAMLRVDPDRGLAVALVANGGDVGSLVGELFGEMFGTPAAIEVPAPTPVGDRDRVTGRYELRNQVSTVTADGAGRLWLTREERNDAAAMAARAGVALQPSTTELRRYDGDTFVMVDDERPAGLAELVDGRFLHTGRAAPRARSAP